MHAKHRLSDIKRAKPRYLRYHAKSLVFTFLLLPFYLLPMSFFSSHDILAASAWLRLAVAVLILLILWGCVAWAM